MKTWADLRTQLAVLQEFYDAMLAFEAEDEDHDRRTWEAARERRTRAREAVEQLADGSAVAGADPSGPLLAAWEPSGHWPSDDYAREVRAFRDGTLAGEPAVPVPPEADPPRSRLLSRLERLKCHTFPEGGDRQFLDRTEVLSLAAHEQEPTDAPDRMRRERR